MEATPMSTLGLCLFVLIVPLGIWHMETKSPLTRCLTLFGGAFAGIAGAMMMPLN